MTHTEEQIDKHRDMLLAMALTIASKVLMQVDEQELSWVGVEETHRVEEASINIRVEYKIDAPYVQIYIEPKDPNVQTVDMGPFVMLMMNHGGVSMQIPRPWIEKLIQAGATL